MRAVMDLFMGLPEMVTLILLTASYDEAVQELRGLEVERETLLFQVDVLQDTLESVEELLAEAQREAGQANLALINSTRTGFFGTFHNQCRNIIY
ncbi:hypothetical protein XENOCAPTIV_029781, partial [Xenoophorus captivus]